MQKHLLLVRLIIIMLFISTSFIGCGKNNASILKQNFTMTELGGTFHSKDSNIIMTFTEGSVTKKSTFKVETASNLPSNSENIPGTAYTFGPEGTVFQKPVQLSIKFDSTKMPTGIQETSLCLAKLVDGSWQRILNSQVDTTSKMVSGFITGFSTYSLIGSDMSVTIDPNSLSCYPDEETRLIPQIKNAPAGYDLKFTWLTKGESGTIFFYNENGVLVEYGSTGVSLQKDGSVSFKARSDAPVGSTETVTIYISSTIVDDNQIKTNHQWVEATFTIKIVSKIKPFWYLSGGEDPKASIKWESHSPTIKVNGKSIPQYYDGYYYPFSANPGDLLEITISDFPRGDHYSLGPLWLHLWDGAKKVKLADSVDLGFLPDDSSIDRTVQVYQKTFTIPPLKPPLTVDPAELAYDDGISEGGCSLGGKNQYGFLVRFTPATPFKVTKIKIFSWIKETPKADSLFTVRITDPSLNLKWGTSLPYTLFTTDHSWLEIDVPDYCVDKEFCVGLYAPSFGPGTGPYVGVDQTGPNLHSEMIGNWKSTAWDTPISQEQANWMIRVEGNAVSPHIEWAALRTPVVTGTTDTQLTLGGWEGYGTEHADLTTSYLRLGTPFDLIATLTSSGKPLDGKAIDFQMLTDGSWKSVFNPYTTFLKGDYLNPTAGNGRAEFLDSGRDGNSIITKPGIYQFRAVFDGDSTYSKAIAYLKINVIPFAYLELETPEFDRWDAPVVISGRLWDSMRNPIVGAPVYIRYSDDQGQTWRNLPGGELLTDGAGLYQVKLGGGQTPVFPKQGSYKIKAVFIGGDYNGVTFNYTESIVVSKIIDKGLVYPELKTYNDNPVSFEHFKVTCTVTPQFGIPVTGPVVVILYANWNGLGDVQIEKYSGNDTVITFDVSLTSGNYEISAVFQESSYYIGIRNSINIKVGN